MPKTLRGKRGQLQFVDKRRRVPRDHNTEFEPYLVKRGRTRFDGVDEKIISLYARDVTTYEIQGHLQAIHGIEVAPGLVSTIPDAVQEEVSECPSRPLDTVYPIIYLETWLVKVRSNGACQENKVNKAIYLASAINSSGRKEVLGLWATEIEGAKFWL